MHIVHFNLKKNLEYLNHHQSLGYRKETNAIPQFIQNIACAFNRNFKVSWCV